MGAQAATCSLASLRAGLEVQAVSCQPLPLTSMRTVRCYGEAMMVQVISAVVVDLGTEISPHPLKDMQALAVAVEDGHLAGEQMDGG